MAKSSLATLIKGRVTRFISNAEKNPDSVKMSEKTLDIFKENKTVVERNILSLYDAVKVHIPASYDFDEEGRKVLDRVKPIVFIFDQHVHRAIDLTAQNFDVELAIKGIVQAESKKPDAAPVRPPVESWRTRGFLHSNSAAAESGIRVLRDPTSRTRG